MASPLQAYLLKSRSSPSPATRPFYPVAGSLSAEKEDQPMSFLAARFPDDPARVFELDKELKGQPSVSPAGLL